MSKKLIKFQIGLDILSLIIFGIISYTDESIGYLMACLWVIIAMLAHLDDYDRLKKQ